MWIFIVIVLVVIILVAVVKNDNKQIQIDHLQNGGFRKSYPLVTECLEEDFKMGFFEDLGNLFSYSKTVVDANNKNGTLFIGLKLNSGRETIIFSNYLSSDGVKYEGTDVSTLFTSKKLINEGILFSIEKLQKDGILPVLIFEELNKLNNENFKINDTEAVINLVTAGSLKYFLLPADQKKITQLTLSGEINGSDLRILRIMSGNDENGRRTTGYNLQILDISNTIIVDGGDYYYAYEDWDLDIRNYLNTSNNSIGEYAFHNCSNLKTIYLPNNVSTIKDFAFQNCFSLQKIKLPYKLVSIGNCVFDSDLKLKSIELPLSLEIIESHAFSSCGIDFINIPEKVRIIGESAFSVCFKLTSVVINRNIEIIEENAFELCSNLSEIHIKKDTPLKISKYVFNKVPKSSCILKVPVGAKKQYQKSPVWCEFETILEV